MEVAALDELAGGRAVLGLGASNRVWMQEQLGIPFERPLVRLREAVEVVRALLRGGRVDLEGDAWSVHAGLAFRPLRRDVPVVLGVKGRRALALADEVADGVLLSVLSSAPYVRWVRSRLRRPVPLSAYVVFACDDDGSAARDRIRPVVATYLGLHGDHDITREAGLDPERAALFREGWLAGAPRVDLVDDELLRRFAVAGTLEDCVTGFADLASAGVDSLLVRDDGTTGVEELVAVAGRCADAIR
jgi:5,10-methylenetetrahydromethanopterin reductase